MRNLLLIVSFALALPLFAQNKTIDSAASSVTFTITNAGLDVEGKFTEISGSIVYSPSDLSNARFSASVNVSSIDTDIDMRDDHLKSKDYFDVAKYPYMKFESTAVTKTNVKGKLTIKDVTQSISFPYSTYLKSGKTHFKGEFKIDRRDFNVGGKSWIMGDEVEVVLDIAIN